MMSVLNTKILIVSMVRCMSVVQVTIRVILLSLLSKWMVVEGGRLIILEVRSSVTIGSLSLMSAMHFLLVQEIEPKVLIELSSNILILI